MTRNSRVAALAELLHEHGAVTPTELNVSACHCGWQHEIAAHCYHLQAILRATDLVARDLRTGGGATAD